MTKPLLLTGIRLENFLKTPNTPETRHFYKYSCLPLCNTASETQIIRADRFWVKNFRSSNIVVLAKRFRVYKNLQKSLLPRKISTLKFSSILTAIKESLVPYKGTSMNKFPTLLVFLSSLSLSRTLLLQS